MVPAYDPHTLVTFGGKLQAVTANDEIWQCGIRGMNTTGGGPVGASQLQNLVDAIATQTASSPNLAQWFADDGNRISNTASLTFVKAANIGANGKYTSDPGIHNFGTPVAGGTAPSVPSYMSVCLSFTTAVQFGRKLRYGRVYPPNYGVPFSPGGASLAPAQVAFLLQSAQRLLHAVAQSGSEFGFTPMVVSSKGGHSAIQGVRVGNIIDVHRSRRNAVSETYQTAPYPPS